MNFLPVQKLTGSICGFLAAAVLFALISSIWQHVAAVAFTTIAGNMAYGMVRSEVGKAAMGLGWSSLALYVVAFCGVLVLILSVRFLNRLTDD